MNRVMRVRHAQAVRAVADHRRVGHHHRGDAAHVARAAPLRLPVINRPLHILTNYELESLAHTVRPAKLEQVYQKILSDVNDIRSSPCLSALLSAAISGHSALTRKLLIRACALVNHEKVFRLINFATTPEIVNQFTEIARRCRYQIDPCDLIGSSISDSQLESLAHAMRPTHLEERYRKLLVDLRRYLGEASCLKALLSAIMSGHYLLSQKLLTRCCTLVGNSKALQLISFAATPEIVDHFYEIERMCRNVLDPHALDKYTRKINPCYAATYGLVDVLKRFFYHGIHANRELDPRTGILWLHKITRLLHYASNEATARLIVENGGAIEERDEDAMTPLMSAVTAGRTDVIQYLLSQRADVDCFDASGNTALHYATSPESVNLLYSAGHCELWNRWNHTPLERYIQQNIHLLPHNSKQFLDAIICFLQHGASIELFDGIYTTAVLYNSQRMALNQFMHNYIEARKATIEYHIQKKLLPVLAPIVMSFLYRQHTVPVVPVS